MVVSTPCAEIRKDIEKQQRSCCEHFEDQVIKGDLVVKYLVEEEF